MQEVPDVFPVHGVNLAGHRERVDRMCRIAHPWARMGGRRAWSGGSSRNDCQIVGTPSGQCMVEGPAEQLWESRETREHGRAYESHFAMAVERSASEILELSRAAGWHARVCSRGGFFDL